MVIIIRLEYETKKNKKFKNKHNIDAGKTSHTWGRRMLVKWMNMRFWLFEKLKINFLFFYFDFNVKKIVINPWSKCKINTPSHRSCSTLHIFYLNFWTQSARCDVVDVEIMLKPQMVKDSVLFLLIIKLSSSMMVFTGLQH